MNITSVKPAPGAFANGFSYFCVNCGHFFTVQVMGYPGSKTVDREASFCPRCGEDEPVTTVSELMDHLEEWDTDPVNFYSAFPHDEPIPNSRTGATPDQVKWIIGCIISDRQKKLPVTTESLSAQLGYNREMVKRVFEELHITETGVEG